MTRFRIITPLASQWLRPSSTMKKVLKAPPAKQWFGFLRIPEATSGRFEIRHRHYPPGTVFKTASSRTALFAGHECVQVVLPPDEGAIVHELCEGEGGVWMTDLPIEQAQIDRDLEPMRGTVLVGGLGLGYAAQVLAMRKKVTRVVVIERSPEVIELVAPHLKGSHLKTRTKIEVVCADLHAWLRQNREARFDWAFYDIWAPDGERVFFDHVVPLRELSRDIVPNENVRCWNEDVMRGQLDVGLMTRVQVLQNPEVFKDSGITLDKLCEPVTGVHAKHLKSFNACVPFFRAIRDGRIAPQDALGAAKLFVANLGIPGRRLPC